LFLHHTDAESTEWLIETDWDILQGLTQWKGSYSHQ